MTVKNVSAWRLNAAEKAILAERVAAGECEAAVKRELQTKKAEANEERKLAAQAVAQKAQKQAQQGRAKAKAKAGAKAAAAAPPSLGDDQGAQRHRQPWLLLAGASRHRHDPCRVRCRVPDAAPTENFRGGDPEWRAGAVRASKSSRGPRGPWHLQVQHFDLVAESLQSPTPGVPMSRKRVMDLAEFSFGSDGTPRFHSERMIEVAVSKSDVETEQPSNLQMISPEELVHASFAGCAMAIQILGSLSHFSPFET